MGTELIIEIERPDGTIVEIEKPNENSKLSFQNMMKMATIQSGQDLSPAGLMQTGFEKVQQGTKKLGEFTKGHLESKGVNPTVSKVVGKAIEFSPDIVSLAASPITETPGLATGMARRSLGFQKSFLKTPFARGQATQAAETALKEGIIPRTGNPFVAFQRARELAAKTGQRIGKVLESTPGKADDVFDNLEVLRQQVTRGKTEGVFAKANSAIDEVQKTIVELAGQGEKLTASDLTAIKTRIGKSMNYLTDLASQSDNKAIVSTLGSTIRNLVKTFQSPEVFSKFSKDQKLYNSLALMLKGLNNEVAGQMGNIVPSVTGTVAAAGNLAAGNPMGAVAALGMTELLKRRGFGMGARAIQSAGHPGRIAPSLASILSRFPRKKNKEDRDNK